MEIKILLFMGKKFKWLVKYWLGIVREGIINYKKGERKNSRIYYSKIFLKIIMWKKI